ncbi:BlaI/MecI/CopY family transcriptional regulator [Kitasatospora sp. NPDC051914]|uniref:BlaI/MecI/CopY family transcriptional regulator n=1 Tax=Kitasatospora sp. NPDC051914 TaxID=3154945 RepID=UPI003441D221
MRRLGDLEAQIMDRLWSWGPATVREIVDDLNRERPLAYNTVMTVADILHGKGMLRREKVGRAWLYEPTRSRESYTAALMEDALGASSDRSSALAYFVERISPDEQEALRQALRSLTGRAEPQ